jgi:hypothetical protein
MKLTEDTKSKITKLFEEYLEKKIEALSIGIKAPVRFFNLDAWKFYHAENITLNCHVCKKTFSPITALIIPTEQDGYFGNSPVHYRVFAVMNVEGCICEHLKESSVLFTCFYDTLDPIALHGTEVFGEPK